MGLSNAEVVRLRAELGYNAVQVANPYLTTYALFETIIKTYVEDGGDTTSSTAVTASSTGQPAVVTLTLAAIPTGLAAGDRVIIDVDTLEEKSTVRALNGSTIDVLLMFAHTGTYRVAVDGGVAMVREKLRYIRDLSDRIQKAARRAGLKSVDGEVEFFAPKDMNKVQGVAGALWEQREWERRELANFLGVRYLRAEQQSSASQSLTPH
jgi:hypothetical protein